MSNTRHLSEDQIIQAVVDGPETAEEIQRHLESCAHCRTQVEALEADLGTLSHRAAQEIEAPPRPAAFAAKAAAPVRRKGLWAAAIAGGLAAAAALVLALLPGAQQPQNAIQPATQVAVQEQISLEDDMYWLPEDTFSNFDQYIMAAEEQDQDEEFLNFVAPDIDQTTSLNDKGREQC